MDAQAGRLPWLLSSPGTALASAPALVVLLGAGLLLNAPTAAAIAAGAAVTVAFGAFKPIHGSVLTTMALACAGMCISTLVGTTATRFESVMILAVLFWGFGAGLLSALRPDLGWVAQQCTITLLVAAAFPGSLEAAAERALLVLAGGGLQILFIASLRWLSGISLVALKIKEIAAGTSSLWLAAKNEVRSLSPTTWQAVRLALVLALAVGVWRGLQLQNGYWMAMTVLLLVRPNLRNTTMRAAERIVGTVVGAILATFISQALSGVDSPPVRAALTGAFAVLALALQQGNRIGSFELNYHGSYSVFAACLTAYIVFLLDYGGLNARAVAGNRVLVTVLGGVLALLVHVPIKGFTLFRKPTEKTRESSGGLSSRPA